MARSTRLTSLRRTLRSFAQPWNRSSKTADQLSAGQHLTQQVAGKRDGVGGASGRDDLPLIRAWAESQRLGVSSRGRIKKEIIDQYDAAHS